MSQIRLLKLLDEEKYKCLKSSDVHGPARGLIFKNLVGRGSAQRDQFLKFCQYLFSTNITSRNIPFHSNAEEIALFDTYYYIAIAKKIEGRKKGRGPETGPRAGPRPTQAYGKMGGPWAGPGPENLSGPGRPPVVF